MKKIIIIVISIIVIFGVAIGVYQYQQKKNFSIEGILPQEAVVYVHFQDVEKNLNEMASIPFWQSIRNINYDLLLREGVVSPQQMAFIRAIQEQLTNVATNPVSKKMFGQEMALAVYLPDIDLTVFENEADLPNIKVMEDIFSGIYLITRVTPDVQFAEIVSRFFTQFGANVTQEQFKYKDETIHAITVEAIGLKFGVVRLSDLLVIGIGEKAARMSIDVYKEDKPALGGDPQFTKIKNGALHPSDITGFVNFDIIVKSLQDQVNKFMSAAGEETTIKQMQGEWQKIFDQMAGVKAFGLFSQLGPIIQMDGHLVFNTKELSPDYASLYTCPSAENPTLHFTPKDIMAYQWSNCFQLDFYWNQIKKELDRTDVPNLRIDELEAQIGLSIERDVLPAFGDELGGYIEEIQVGGLFPIPSFLVFVEINDQSKAKKLIGKLEDQPVMLLKEENYNGIALKYFALPLGQNLQPGYGFLNNYLLISTSKELIKKSIDASKNSTLSLLTSSDLKEINLGFEASRGIHYIKLGEIMDKIKGVVQWANQWTESQDLKKVAFKQGAQKTIEEVDANIAAKELELKEVEGAIAGLEDEVWNLETKGEDVSAKQTQLNELIEQIENINDDIEYERNRKVDLTEVVAGYEEDAPDPALRKLYIEEVLYPILDGFKSIKFLGLKSTLLKNDFKSSMYLKVR